MTIHFKKISIALLIASTSTALAGAMGPDNMSNPYDGFYLGATVGASNLLDDASWLIQPENHDLGAIGIIGGGFFGYDYSLTERAKLGVEGFVNASGLNASIQHYYTETSYSINSRYNAGIRILPGFQFAPETVWHLILGYSNAQFEINDNAYGYLNKTYNKSGFQSGLGLTSSVIGGLSVRLDTMYTIYAAQSSTGFSKVSGSGFQYYTNDFSTLEGDLSLVYKFNL